MKRCLFYRLYLACALALAWIYGSASASTVFWGSAFQDNLFDSKGSALDSSYSFEIGSFVAGFDPTTRHVSEWQANWKVFDRAYDPDANGWNSSFQFFVATVDHNADGTSSSPDASPLDVFTQGAVAYLWAYNSKSIVPGSEWALVTDGSNTPNQWRFPNPADTAGSYNWDLATANTAVFGGANGVRGDGTFSATPAVFSLQTAVVPEPGSALLLFVALAGWASRRIRP